MFQVFQVFRVFQVFHVRFWTTKPPDFGPNPNKPGKPSESSHRHIMATENTQKSNSPTGLRTRYCPVCNSRSSFSAKRLFFRAARRQTEAPNPPSEKVYCGGCGKGVGFSEILSHPVDAGGRIVCNKALGSVKKKEQRFFLSPLHIFG